VTVAAAPSGSILIKCIAGGSSTTSTWQTSVDAGATWSPTWTAAASVVLPRASFVTLAFGAGTSVTGDVVTIPTQGAPSLTSGTGTLVPTVSTACPVDAYTAIVAITTAGATGVAMFTYSLDGGVTVSQPYLVPSGAPGVFSIPDAGVNVSFTGTFTKGDTYSFTTTTASFSSTDVTNAWTAMVADSRLWFMAHVVGAASSVANAASLAASLETLAVAASSAYRFVRVLMEVPKDTDANTLAAFASTTTPHVSWCAGFHTINSALSGRDYSRNSAWSVAARVASIPPAEDPGRVQSGPLLGVLSLDRDERKTPGLDDGRFTTLQTILGLPGFWVTNWRLGAAPGSDFTFGQNGRVMDLVAAAYRNGLLHYLNESFRVNKGDGTINEKDALACESYLNDYIGNSLPANTISSLAVTIDRTNNMLSNQTLKAKCAVIPRGYAKTIIGDLGFTSSALAIS
jgi:hypothetical protein